MLKTQLDFDLAKSSITSQLPDKDIASLAIDHSGFLYMGTRSGLYRFDGDRLLNPAQQSDSDPNILSSNIMDIVAGDLGNIWLASNKNGIFKLSWRLESPRSPPEQTLTRRPKIHHLLNNNGDLLLYSTQYSGIGVFSKSRNSYQKISKIGVTPISSDRSAPLLRSRSGKVILGGDKGLYLISPNLETAEFIPLPANQGKGAQFGPISSLLNVSTDSVLAGTRSGQLLEFSMRDRAFKENSNLAKINLAGILDTALFADRIWIATTGGLALLRPDFTIEEVFKVGNSALFDDVVHVLLATNDSLWIGTHQGLNFITPSNFELIRFPKYEIHNDVNSFTVDSHNQLWISTFDGVFAKAEGTNNFLNLEQIYPEFALVDKRVMAISSIDRQLWLGFLEDGLKVIDLDTGGAIPIKVSWPEKTGVVKVLATKDKRIFIAAYGAGLYYKDGPLDAEGRAEIRLEKTSLREKHISDIIESTPHSIVVGTDNGVFIVDPKTMDYVPARIQVNGSTLQPIVLVLKEDNTGRLWLGTQGDGVLIQTEKQKSATKYFGDFRQIKIPHDIYGIEFDDQNTAWVSTSNGLARISESEDSTTYFTVESGLQGNNFNHGASFKDPQGRIYFGGANGFNRFIPKEVRQAFSPSKIILTNIKIKEELPITLAPIHELEKVILSHDNNFISFRFSTLDFRAPEKNQFRYKLNDFDNDWIDSGTQNTATYAKLPAGDYIFKVIGANSLGVWNTVGASIDVEVLPAPWKTWWAYCFYALLALGLFLLIKKLYDDRLITKRATALAEQMRHAAEIANDDLQEQLEIQDDLVKSVYAHNTNTLEWIRDVLSVDQDGEVKSELDGDTSRIEALKLLEDSLLYKDEVLFVDMHKYCDLLINHVSKDSKVDIESITTMNEITDRLTPVKLATPIAIVLFELLKNCFLHAFETSEIANYIRISLEYEKVGDNKVEQILLRVQDSGSGFPQGLSASSTESTGLTIINAIVSKLNGDISSNFDNGSMIEIVFPVQDAL